jgi:protocatechuate 3,4-dioxygenase beta subunit
MGHRALCCVVALWIASAGAAEEPSSADPSPRISAVGHVIDPTGKPVRGARVVLREWSSLRYSDDVYQNEVQDILVETTTDAEGRFQFDDVPWRPFRNYRDRSPWDIVAMADGYGAAWVHLKQANNEQRLTLKLAEASSIAGRILDPAGEPIANCSVAVGEIAPPGARWNSNFDDPLRLDLWKSQLAPAATTDANGEFEIPTLPVGQRVTLIAEHADFVRGIVYVATTDEPKEAVEKPPAGKRRETETMPVHSTGFTQTLERGARFQGQVVFDDTGKPAAKAKVNLQSQKRGFYYCLADDAGRFEFVSLPVAEFQLFATTDDPGYLGVRLQLQLPHDGPADQRVFRFPRGEAARGQVVDTETRQGMAGVGLIYVPAGQDDLSWTPAQLATTDATGRFEMAVPPGPGEIRLYRVFEPHPTHDVPDFSRWMRKQALSPDHSAKIDVKAGAPVEGVRLAVGRGMVVRGVAVDPRGKPVFGAAVRARDRFGGSEYQKQAVTGDDGRFELGGFPPHGELQIEVVDEVGRLRGTATVAADPAAGPNRVAELGNIQLRCTGSVVGTVLGDGNPLAGVRVHLSLRVDRDGREDFAPIDPQAETGSDGRFRFETVEAGTRVSARAYADAHGFTSEGTRYYALAAGQELELPIIELKSRSAFVAGIVVDPNGQPVAGVTVSARKRDGRSITFGRRGPTRPTGANGRFRIEDLPNVPLELLAYIRPPAETKDRIIHFPARVHSEPGQTDLRIVLDPKLQRPLP